MPLLQQVHLETLQSVMKAQKYLPFLPQLVSYSPAQEDGHDQLAAVL